jgi:hypothetical protein
VKVILFTFEPGILHPKQKQILNKILGWDKVTSAAPLFPGSETDPELSKVCFANVEDTADIQKLLNQLKELHGINDAFLPADRGLI